MGFKMKLVYPDSTTKNVEGSANIWRQTTNPVTATKGGVDGYESIQTPWTGYRWKGLEHGSHALLDGSVNKGWWFYAIGATRTWKKGYPATSRTPEKKVELYAYFDSTSSTDEE